MEENVKILIIDDSPLALKSLRTIIELHPVWKIVGEAGNGRDGLAMFHQTQPTVVIVDFQMPGMNGIEVGREIRRTNSQALLILFSLHTGKQLEELAKAAGFDAVISKDTPFPIVGIIETLNMRTRHAEAVPSPIPAPLANAGPAHAAAGVPATVTESSPTPIIEVKQVLPSSLGADEHPEPKRVGNEGVTNPVKMAL